MTGTEKNLKEFLEMVVTQQEQKLLTIYFKKTECIVVIKRKDSEITMNIICE